MESLSKGLRVGTQTEKGRNKVWVLKSVTTAGPTPLGNNVVPVILIQRKGKSGGRGAVLHQIPVYYQMREASRH